MDAKWVNFGGVKWPHFGSELLVVLLMVIQSQLAAKTDGQSTHANASIS